MRISTKGAVVALLLALGLLAFLAVLYAVPGRAGGTWDSICYLGTARNLARGLGFFMAHRLPREPYLLWAPLYPLVLSVPCHFGVDPACAAKWINAFCLGCTTFLTGFIAWVHSERSHAFGALAALSVLFSADMIEIHSEAMSEPIFIVFILACIAGLHSCLRSGTTKNLLWTAVAISAVLVTRYAGISMLIAAAILISATRRGPSQRSAGWVGLALALIIAVTPLGVWLAHNASLRAVASEPRKVAVHLLGARQIRDLFATFSRWLVPRALPKYVGPTMLVALAAAIFGTLLTAIRFQRRAAEKTFRSALWLAQICVVFDVTYVLVLVLTVSFYDRDAPLDLRLLLPIYPVCALLLGSCIVLRRKMFGRQSVVYRALCGVSLLLVASNGARFFQMARHIHERGIGFQEVDWPKELVIKYVASLPASTLVYTDNSNLMYHATGRATYELPFKFNNMTTLANPDFEAQMGGIAKRAAAASTVVVQFKGDWPEGPYPTSRELVEKWGFHPVMSARNKPPLCGEGFTCWSVATTVLANDAAAL